jgi:hypothetical protein
MSSYYHIESANVTVGSANVVPYSFITTAAGTLQLERPDGGVSILDVDGEVHCDTILPANVAPGRVFVSDPTGRLEASTFPTVGLGNASYISTGVLSDDRLQGSYSVDGLVVSGGVGANTLTANNLVGNALLVSDAGGKVVPSPVTATEAGSLSGVSRNVQNQLNDLVSGSTVIQALDASNLTTGVVSDARLQGSYTMDGLAVSGGVSGNTLTATNLAGNALLVSDAGGKVVPSPVTATEAGYLSGVTRNVQDQLSDLASGATPIQGLDASNLTTGVVSDARLQGSYTMDGLSVSGGVSGNTLTATNLVGNALLVSDAGGKVVPSPATATEAGYLSGVSRNVQNQLNDLVSGSTVIQALDASNLTTGVVGDARLQGSYTMDGLSVSGGVSGNTLTATNLAGNALLVSDAAGKVVPSQTTATEAGHLRGVTRNVQNQLNDLVSGATVIQALDASKITAGQVGTGYLPSASVSDKGIVQLSTSTSSTSQSVAATSSAVKATYDYASTKVSKSGDSMSGNLVVGGTIIATGTGDHRFGSDGRFAITLNDGQGNLNLTFNHDSGGVPEQAGSAYRIRTNVDESTAQMAFQMKDSVTAGESTVLDSIFVLSTSGATVAGDLDVGGDLTVSGTLTGDGSGLVNLDASAIVGGTLSTANLPSASLSQEGVVRLSDSLTSTSTSLAATASVVRALNLDVTSRALNTVQISPGSGLVGGGTLSSPQITLSHADTSSATSEINSSESTFVIKSVQLDSFGHVTAISSEDLSTRYITLSQGDARYARLDDIDNSFVGNMHITGTFRVGHGDVGTQPQLYVVNAVDRNSADYHDDALVTLRAGDGQYNGMLIDMDDDDAYLAGGGNNQFAFKIRTRDSALTSAGEVDTKFMVRPSGRVLINYGSTHTVSGDPFLAVNGDIFTPGDVSSDTVNAQTVTATTFVGGGGQLTGLSASNISTGTLNVQRLDSSVFRTGLAVAGDLRFAQSNGRGIRFWDSDQYKIYMSATTDGTWGGRLDSTSDYNIYLRMTGGTNRGVVFRNNTTNVAQIDGGGNLYLTGILQSGTVPWARLSGIPTASLSSPGLVTLSSSVTSTSTSVAATASAVRQAYLLAQGKLSSSGGTLTGSLTAPSLTVSGDVSSRALILQNTENDGSFYPVDISGTVAFDENFYSDAAYGSDAYSPASVFTGGDGGGLLIRNEDGWGAVYTSQNTRWATGTWHNLRVIQRVGIGLTAAPQYPLDVNGDIRFTGTLRGGSILATTVSGDGSGLTGLDATVLTGTVPVARLPSGTTSAKGIVQLSNTVGTSTTLAATPAAVKFVQDQLGGKVDTSVSVNAGSGLVGGGTLSGSRTLSHADTSSQASVTNSDKVFIQSIGLDQFGHITSIQSSDLGDYFAGAFTQNEADGLYLSLSGGTLTGGLVAPSFTGDGSGLTGLDAAALSGSISSSLLPSGSTTAAGIVQLSNTVGTSTTLAATPAAVKSVQDQLGDKVDTSVSIIAGGGLVGGGALSGSRTLSHADTSTQTSITNSGRTVVQSIGVDGFGHIQSIGSVNLDTSFLSLGGGTLTGGLGVQGNVSATGTSHLFGLGGALGITLNDGQGNLNLCFNHAGGIPDQDGSACRITASVDSTTGSMTFQIGDSVLQGVSTSLENILTLTTTGATFHVPLSCTTISGDGSLLSSLNASNITSGVVNTARLPGASTTSSGIVQLSNSLTSTSQTQAATAAAAKTLKDDIETRALKGTTISTGAGLVGGGSLFANRVLSHADTSSQESVINSNSVVIQSIEVDQFGHVTSLSSVNLDVFAETDSRYLQLTGGTMSGGLTAPIFSGALDVSTQGRLSHIQNDGALYRYDGQVYITVDDNFYIRDSSGAAATENYQFHFDTNTGTFTATGSVVANSFSGSGAGLTNLPAGQLTGTVPTGVLPVSSTSASGIVRLSTSTTSTSTTLAATSSAVKSVRDSVNVVAGRTISAGSGLVGGGDLTSDRTLSHADTSSQESVTNTGRTFIQSIGVDGFGHVTSVGSANLDTYLNGSFYTKTQTDARYLALGGGTLTGGLVAPSFTGDGSGLTGLDAAALSGAISSSLLPSGTTTAAGIVQLSNTVGTSTTLAATPAALKSVQDQLEDKVDTSVSVIAGGGLVGGGALSASRTLSHADTSTQGSITNSGRTVVQSIGVDGFGHVTSLGSVNLDTSFLSLGGGTLTGGLGVQGNVSATGTSHLFGNVLGITLNDGQGDLNLAFNHAGGVPYQDGSAYRITTSVDNTVGSMTFQIGDFAFQGVSTTLTDILSLTTTGATFSVPLSCTTISGDGSLLHSLNASNITSGVVSTARLPGASTGSSGIVQLSNSVTSTSQTTAATSLAAKNLQDDVNTRALKTTAITAGGGLSGGGDLSTSRTISHADTSTQGDVNNSGGSVIQDVNLDTYGHVVGLGSTNLDTRYLKLSGGTMTGGLTVPHITMNNGSGTSLITGEYVGVNPYTHLTIQNSNDNDPSYIQFLHNYTSVSQSGSGPNGEIMSLRLYSLGGGTTDQDTRVYVPGRLGVGSSSPGYSLDVSGDVRFTGTLQGGTVPWARLSSIPSATTSASGLVQLSTSLTSTSTTRAATSSAVKSVKDSLDTLAGRTITAGSGLVGGGDLSSSRTISHADTSSQASVSYSGGTVVSGVGLDQFGHIVSLSSVNLDDRYLSANGVVSGNLNVEGNTHLFGTGGQLGITLNDGQGNLNLTFNHAGGVPDQDGSACRITTSVDNTTGSMTFQVGDGVFEGISTTLSDILSLTTTGATFSVPLSCTTISGNGSLLSSLNASNITSGVVSTARLPGASTGSSGIVQLSNSLTSTSQTTAATSLAAKNLQDDIDTRVLKTTTISAGSGLVGGGNLSSNRTLSHADTSSQGSVSYTGGVVVAGVGLDQYGHVTSLSSVDLDSRYLSSSGVVSGNITVEGTTHLFGTSGKLGITLNDGEGDLNLTFNHAGGVPDQDGSACRITTSVDNTTGSMTFQVGDGVFEGISTTLSDILSLTTTGATFSVPLSCTTISGNGSLLSSLNASNITSGVVSTARLPGASTGSSGIVQLSNSLTSTSQTTAATSLAAKNLQDDIDTRAPKGITISAGSGLVGGGSLFANRVISHAPTSNQTSVINSNSVVIQSIEVDQFGHVTSLSSANLDVFGETDSRYLPFSGGTITGALTAPLFYGALDVSTQPRLAHIPNDGALYRYDGQVYITVDDNFYIRDSSGAATTENYQFHFSTNTGTFTATGGVVATSFSGSGAGLTNLPAGQLTGSVPTGVLPVSSTSASGIVKLSTSTTSTSTTLAATSSAVKSVKDSVNTLAGRTISAGGGLVGGGDLTSNRTLSHANTSNQGSVSYSGGVVVSGVGLDQFGHVTSLSSVDLDSRYLSASSGVVSGNAVFQGSNHLFGTDGKFGITINDGQGNLNLTFNHGNGGVPDQNGSACRIETSVDGDVGSFVFEVGDYVTAGVEVALTEVMRIDTSGVTVYGPLGATSLSGNGSAITSLNASAISSGIVDRTYLPTGTTGATGLVQLSTSTSSTSSSVAATPSAVKAAFDLASGKVSKSGDVMTGQLKINDSTTSSGYVSGAPSISCGSWMYTKGLVNTGETGSGPAAIIFGDGSTFGTDKISLVASGNRVVYVTDGNVTVSGSLSATSLSGSLAWSNLTSVPSASTSAAGIVQLSSATTSTSTSLAATASAVKSAYDLAAGKVSKTGDTMSGNLSFGSSTRQMINLYDAEYAIGIQGYTAYFRTGANFAWYKGGTHNNTELDAGGGTALMTLTSTGLGLGTTTPSFKLDCHGTSNFTGTMTLPTVAGTNQIQAGNGDGASYTTNNIYIRSWWGLGFRDYEDTCRTFLDTRTGNFSTQGSVTASSFSGNGGSITSINASNLSSGTVNVARLPNASTTAQGVVQLSTSTTSTSTTQAPTLSALKAVQDNANTRALKSISLTAGTGLSGGGNLSANRTFSVDSTVFRSGAAIAGDLRLSSGNGRGVRFWDSDQYKIYMSGVTDSTWGGRLDSSSDYNMYFIMAAGTNRGFVFRNNTTNVAQIDGAGNLYFSGTLQSGTVPWARLSGTPSASTSAAGIVRLSTSTTSTSTTQAPTLSALKAVQDNANTRALKSISLTAGTGLSGGGNLSANRTFNVSPVLFNNFGDNNNARTNFNATYDFGWRYVTGATYGPGVNGASQYYSVYVGLGANYSSAQYGMQIAYPRNVSNPYISIRYRENTNWGGWNKISAGYADSAGSANSVAWSNVSGGTSTQNFTANRFYANDWFRVNGNDGIYWESHGGGWTMTDSTWVKTYNNKSISAGSGNIYTSGAICAGTTSPVAKLDIRGDTYTTGNIRLNNGSPTIAFQDTDQNSGFIHVADNRMYVLGGDNNATGWRQINGQWPMIFFLSTNDALLGGSFSAVGNVTAYASDRRLKTNILPLQNTLDIIKKLGGYTFEWKEVENMPMSGNDLGLIAQDLEEAGLGDLLLTHAPFDRTEDQKGSKSGEFYKTIHYDKLHGIWAQGLKEQQEMIEQEQAENRALRRTVDQLTAQMKQMMTRLQMLEEHIH